MKINKIKRFLKKYNNFFISVHTSPEPDALGSELAFAYILKSLGKSYQIINTDKPLPAYSFLPKINMIRHRPLHNKIGAAVILDCATLSRIGQVKNFLDKSTPILNIDHHISNSYFGDINIVDTQASSTSEIIYSLFKELKIKINKTVALLLYSGIAADTGFFRYSNTTSYAHKIAADLLKYKLDTSGIFQNIYGNITLGELAFINRALLGIKTDKKKKIAWLTITKDSLVKNNVKLDIVDYIFNYIRYIKDIQAVALFKENLRERSVRVNLRSNGKVDVNKIAQKFKGGGHRTASGITFRNTSLKKAESLVIGFIQKQIS